MLLSSVHRGTISVWNFTLLVLYPLGFLCRFCLSSFHKCSTGCVWNWSQAESHYVCNISLSVCLSKNRMIHLLLNRHRSKASVILMQMICFERRQFRNEAIFVMFHNRKLIFQQRLVCSSQWNHGRVLHCVKTVPYSFSPQGRKPQAVSVSAGQHLLTNSGSRKLGCLY